MDAEQLLSDKAIIDELVRETKRRDYFVVVLSRQELRELLMYVVGIFVGAWLAGGARG